MRKLGWAMVAMCGLSTGCGDKPIPPFASMPFSVARKGNAVSIPFTVPPSAPLEYTYMLSFKYRRPEAGDPLMMFWSRPQRAHLFLKVRLVSLGKDGVEEEVDLNSWDHGDGSVTAAKAHGSNVFNVDMHATRMDEAYMEVTFFKLSTQGSYRVDVETVEDLKMFESIASWLTVEREYRLHK